MLKSRITGLTLCIAVFGIGVSIFGCLELLRSAGLEIDELGWFAFLLVDKFLVDMLVVLLVAGLLINLSRPWRVLSYIWCLLFFIAFSTQAGAIWIGGEYLTFLAVDNVNHISLLVNPRSIVTAALVVVICIAVVWTVETRFPGDAGKFQVIAFVPVVAGLIATLELQENWVSKKALAARDAVYADRGVRLAHKSPIESLYKVLFRSDGSELRELQPADLDVADQFGISIDPGSQFPLFKPQIYRSNLGFQTSGPGIEKPNVIVFFAEGISARTLGSYYDFKTGLTPNLDDFGRNAMVVDNYYNHSYATYRALLGQLCSFFPTHGGHGGWDTNIERVKRVSYLCLNHLLNKAGYETIFLDTHRKDSAFIDEMMLQLGFDTVLTAEDLVGKHVQGEPLRRDSLSDNQLMEGLVSLLRQMETENADPFFLGLYNLETHAFQKIREDGKRYAEEDHYVLDAIHNFDHAFGKFWNYFRESSWFDNTVVIFTTDHSHYPDRDFLEIARGPAFEGDYKPYFVDRIPMIIRHPGLELPTRYDAGFASSVDFAPSMAHLLKLENQENPFVGNSIFDSARVKNEKALGSAGDMYFEIDSGEIARNKISPDSPEDMPSLPYIIRLIQELEKHDRIWPR